MNCNNCPNNNGTSGKVNRPAITHPQGNMINLTFQITTRAVTVVDGAEQVEEVEVDLSNNIVGKPIVELSRGKKVLRYECDIIQNKVNFIDWGKLPVGTYDISILLNYGETQLLYKKRTALQIVENTEEGGHYENDEFNVVAIYPIIKGRTIAISIADGKVRISENGTFQGDDKPNNGRADVTAKQGEGYLVIEDGKAKLHI